MTPRRSLAVAFVGAAVLGAACVRVESGSVDSASDTARVAPLQPGEGMLAVRGGRIWYRKSGTGSGTPMVVVHGGPGAGSYYLKPFEDIGDDRPVIRYDQLGAGKSDRLTDTTLMTIPRFVEELDSLRRALRIETWFVNGHSWGTVVALEYYKAHPEHVAGIVFGGSVFDWRAYAREVDVWIRQMSDSSQRAIAAWRKGGSPDAPGFQAATEEFWRKFVVMAEKTADGDSTIAGFGSEQYNHMQGAFEFDVVGTLKNYDARADLPRIKVPVLSTTAQFDEVGPKTVEAHAKLIPGARFILYKNAAHITSWDARDANVKDVREFLRSVDKR